MPDADGGSADPSSGAATDTGTVTVASEASDHEHAADGGGSERREPDMVGPLTRAARPARSRERHAVSRPSRSAKKSRMISARIRRCTGEPDRDSSWFSPGKR